MQKRHVIYFILGLLLCISLGFNIHYYKMYNGMENDTTVVIKERIDTIKDTIPQIKYEKEVAVVTKSLPVVKIMHDTLTGIDSAEVEIPISQKVYSDDSTYKAYVSGYQQKLDSIDVYKKTITIDRTIVKTEKKRWSVGPMIYGGYDFVNGKFGVGVGIGVSYGIWRW